MEGAIEYVREVENDRGADYLYESDDVMVSGFVMTIPEVIPPDFWVLIRAADRDEALRTKEELGAVFRKTFDRWDVCQIDIAWDMYAGGSPIIENPNDDSNLDATYVNPGCDRPAVEDHEK